MTTKDSQRREKKRFVITQLMYGTNRLRFVKSSEQTMSETIARDVDWNCETIVETFPSDFCRHLNHLQRSLKRKIPFVRFVHLSNVNTVKRQIKFSRRSAVGRGIVSPGAF